MTNINATLKGLLSLQRTTAASSLLHKILFIRGAKECSSVSAHPVVDSVLTFKCRFPFPRLSRRPHPCLLSLHIFLTLTSLVKITIIFHPLIAHSIQQIGEPLLRLHTSHGREGAVEIGVPDNPPCAQQKW